MASTTTPYDYTGNQKALHLHAACLGLVDPLNRVSSSLSQGFTVAHC